MGYFKDMYGDKIGNKDFIDGVIAGAEAYAVWRNGTQWVGSPEVTLKEAVRYIRKDLDPNYQKEEEGRG
jgi:hypothetical protein